MNPAERRARLANLADIAERRDWWDLVRWCVAQTARLILREAAHGLEMAARSGALARNKKAARTPQLRRAGGDRR